MVKNTVNYLVSVFSYLTFYFTIKSFYTIASSSNYSRRCPWWRVQVLHIQLLGSTAESSLWIYVFGCWGDGYLRGSKYWLVPCILCIGNNMPGPINARCRGCGDQTHGLCITWSYIASELIKLIVFYLFGNRK